MLVVVLGRFHIEGDNEHDDEDDFQERAQGGTQAMGFSGQLNPSTAWMSSSDEAA